MKTYRYSDPTGGGDDAILTLPEWVDPPEDIMARGTANREAHYFEFDGEDEEEED